MTIQIKGGAPLFHVYDMPASLAFYRDVLEFEVVDAAPEGPVTHWAMLRNGGYYLMLNSKYEFDHQRPAQPDTTSGREDVALYLTCDDADAVFRQLQQKGWAQLAEPTTAPYGMRQLLVRDPDGFCLCFQHPVNHRASA
jgi:glyoxylase I family protein